MLSWDPIKTDPNFVLQYFSIKATPDLNNPVEIATAPPTAVSKTVLATFTPQNPKFVYYIVTGVYQGSNGRVEAMNSRTVGAERIGPPPN